MPYDPYDEEDYYTLSNPALAGDRFAPYSEGSVAFSEPSDQGVRYPIATPASEGRQVGTLGDITPDFQRALDEMAARDRQKANPIYSDNDLSRIERNTLEDTGNDPQAIQQAMRLQGLFEYRNYLAQGMPSSEAIQRAAPKLYYNHPAAMASVMNHSGGPQVPIMQSVEGGRLLINPSGHAQYIANPVQRDVAPPDVKQVQKNIATEIDVAKRDLVDAKKDLKKSETPDDKSANGRAALAARDRLADLMKQGVVASTNYTRPPLKMTPNIVTKALTPPPAESRVLDKATAAALLDQAKGDKEAARKLARDAGYKF